MIKELQIRPFARPLLVWIAGIMLQTVFSCCTYSWVLLLLPVIILTTAGLVLRGQEHFCYETRWLWGVLFLSLLLFLSIQKTAYSQFEALSEHPASLLSRFRRLLLVEVYPTAPDPFFQPLHVLVHFAVGHFGVDLRRADALVSHHAADGFDGHAQREGDVRPEIVPCLVEGHVDAVCPSQLPREFDEVRPAVKLSLIHI